MKAIIKKDTINVTLLIFIQDSSSTTGDGLAGVTASMLNGNFARVEDDNDVTVASFDIVDAVGSGTDHFDGALEEITPLMVGWYRLDVPDAVVATGARFAGIDLSDTGANNIAQVAIEIQLVDYDPEDATNLGLSDVAAILTDTGTTIPALIGTPASDIAADIAAVKAETALIVADTNELQTDWTNGGRLDLIIDAILVDTATTIPALIGTPATDLAADIAAVKAETVLIVADTNELQTDWTNGGRLDLILDAILVDTGTTLDAAIALIQTDTTAIVADTNELQTDWANGGRLDLIVDAILVDTATTIPATITALQADLPNKITKNVALANFPFLMVDATDFATPETGLTVTSTRSIDGAAFASCANSASEVSAGGYKINFDASDLNGDTILFRFTAPGAADRFITIVTQPT